MSDQLRFGLIGTGWIGRFHAETLARRLPGVTLVAVADPNIEAARSLNAPRRVCRSARLDRRPGRRGRGDQFPGAPPTPIWWSPRRRQASMCSARSRWR